MSSFGYPVIGSGGSGLDSLNGLTDSSQTFATGNSGTDFNINSSGGVHTFNIPDGSDTARGLISPDPQTFGGQKTFLGEMIIGQIDTADNFIVRPLKTILGDSYSSAAQMTIALGRDDSQLNIVADTASNNGGEIRLFGPSHANINEIHFVTGSGLRAKIDNNGNLSSYYQFLGEDGDASAPTYGFTNSTGLGLYRRAASELGFATNSNEVGYTNASGDWFIGRPNFGSSLYQRTNYVMHGHLYTTANFQYAEQLYRNDWLWRMMASDDTSKGAQLLLGGESHSTYPNKVELRTNNASRFTIDSSGVVVSVGQHRVGSLGVGNSASATTPGTVVKKIEVFDASGTSLGFLPVYDSIT